MKMKIPGIIAFILLFQSVGYFIVFEIRQAIIHEQTKERIEKNIPDCELVIFKISLNAKSDHKTTLQRINKKEFRFHNRMYDIVRQKTCNDTVWYYCISDEEETTLFSDLDSLIKQQQESNPNHKNQQKQQDRFFSLLYDLQLIGHKAFISQNRILMYHFTADIISYSYETVKPPPKNLFKA